MVAAIGDLMTADEAHLLMEDQGSTDQVLGEVQPARTTIVGDRGGPMTGKAHSGTCNRRQTITTSQMSIRTFLATKTARDATTGDQGSEKTVRHNGAEMTATGIRGTIGCLRATETTAEAVGNTGIETEHSTIETARRRTAHETGTLQVEAEALPGGSESIAITERETESTVTGGNSVTKFQFGSVTNGMAF